MNQNQVLTRGPVYCLGHLDLLAFGHANLFFYKYGFLSSWVNNVHCLRKASTLHNSVGLGGLKNTIWCMLILLQDWRRLLVRTQIVDIVYFHHRALQLFSQFNIVYGFESFTCVCRLSCQHQCNYCQVQLCLLLCIVSAYLSHLDTLLLFSFIFTSEQCMGALGYYNKNDKYHEKMRNRLRLRSSG